MPKLNGRTVLNEALAMREETMEQIRINAIRPVRRRRFSLARLMSAMLSLFLFAVIGTSGFLIFTNFIAPSMLPGLLTPGTVVSSATDTTLSVQNPNQLSADKAVDLAVQALLNDENIDVSLRHYTYKTRLVYRTVLNTLWSVAIYADSDYRIFGSVVLDAVTGQVYFSRWVTDGNCSSADHSYNNRTFSYMFDDEALLVAITEITNTENLTTPLTEEKAVEIAALAMLNNQNINVEGFTRKTRLVAGTTASLNIAFWSVAFYSDNGTGLNGSVVIDAVTGKTYIANCRWEDGGGMGSSGAMSGSQYFDCVFDTDGLLISATAVDLPSKSAN